MKSYINNLNKYNYICLIGVAIWVVMTLTSPYLQVYNGDELWALYIAKHLGYTEIPQLMHSEGHNFLWYFLIKPFSYFDFLYPTITKILNYLFAFLFITLLWFKSPFSVPLKFLISVTQPFLVTYPVYGRPYSLAVLCLFILAILYKDRLNKPTIFTAILFITANTCLIGAIGAFAFGAIFLFDYIKEKQYQIIPLLILLLIPISLFVQWYPISMPYYIEEGNVAYRSNFFFLWAYKLRQLGKFDITELYKYFYIIFAGSFIFYFKNNLRMLFFIISAFSIVFYVHTRYPLMDYHFYFLYVFILIAYWIEKKDTKKFFFPICFTLLTLMLCTLNRQNAFWFSNDAVVLKQFANEIEERIPQNSTIYATSTKRHNNILYFINDKKYNIKNYAGQKFSSLAGMQSIYKKINEIPDLNYIINQADDKTYIMIPQEYILQLQKEAGFKYLKPIKSINSQVLYKVDVFPKAPSK